MHMPTINLTTTDSRTVLGVVALLCCTAVMVTVIKCWSTPKMLRGINEKLGRDKMRLDSLTATVKDIQQSQRRNEMFRNPTSKQMHAHQLEEGRRYVEDGGNGEGHARYESLMADYIRRDRENDWKY
jgi:hypothetical protein